MQDNGAFGHGDRLGAKHVIVVEVPIEIVLVLGHPEGISAVLLLFQGRGAGRYRDINVLGRDVLQCDGVGINRTAFRYRSKATAFGDDQDALLRPGDTEVDAINDFAIVTGIGRSHQVVNSATGTFDVARED